MHFEKAGIVKVSTVIIENLFPLPMLLAGYWLIGEAGNDHGSRPIFLSIAIYRGSDLISPMSKEGSILR